MNRTSSSASDPGGHVSPLEQCVVRVCDAVGDFIEYWGFKAVEGRVWAVLALSTKPQTQAQVARLLGLSRASVSVTVTALQRRGLVRPVTDGRRQPLVAVLDVWPSISEVLRSREWMLLESARLALLAAIDEAEQSQRLRESVSFDAGRMRFLLHMTEIAQSLLRLLLALRSPRSVEALRVWARRAAEFLHRLPGHRHER